MDARDSYQELLDLHAELRDLSYVDALLGWDQETMMPPRGATARARQLSTLAGVYHQRASDPRLGECLAACEDARTEFDDVERAMLREMRRGFDKATRLPAALVKELAATESEALQAWRDARQHADFARFAPHLEKLLGLVRRKAEALGFEETLYDALLDEYERGATQSAVKHLFDGLRVELTPLVHEVLGRADRVDASCLTQELDVAAQARFGLHVIRRLGFDFEAGRVDDSTHPFCSSMGHGDTRLTRRFLADDLRPGLFGVIHEAGHGLYEQGLPDRWARTPLGDAVSLGIHESQSRLWENVIARSRPFWEHFTPELQRSFPGRFDGLGAEDLYRAVNQVQASFIRVEADELTYNLHVILRFELERELVAGELPVAEVPSRWSQLMQEFLGITPADDAQGCLQDIHWSMGAIGYFPTYTMGNLYAAQFHDAARRALPDLDDQIRAGHFEALREWLRVHIHDQGKRLLPADLVQQVCGEAPSPQPFLAYIRDKMDAIYGD